MPMLDLSVKEMEVYTGINPKPSDFDQYWKENLDELDYIDANIEIIESDYQVPFAKCYHLYFTGVKGARIHSKLVVPTVQKVLQLLNFTAIHIIQVSGLI